MKRTIFFTGTVLALILAACFSLTSCDELFGEEQEPVPPKVTISGGFSVGVTLTARSEGSGFEPGQGYTWHWGPLPSSGGYVNLGASFGTGNTIDIPDIPSNYTSGTIYIYAQRYNTGKSDTIISAPHGPIVEN